MSDSGNKAVVAVLGAGGTMPAGTAPNLAAAGFELRAWNRSAQRIEQLAQLPRVSAFQSAVEAADGATALITILSDVNATRETIEAVGSTASGALWLQMGTVGIEGLRSPGVRRAQRVFAHRCASPRDQGARRKVMRP